MPEPTIKAHVTNPDHTPTPWVIERPGIIVGNKKACAIKREGAFDWVATVQVSNVPEWQANAEFIVRAVNSYDEMLEALDFVLKAQTGPDTFVNFDAEFIEELRALIAKAKRITS